MNGDKNSGMRKRPKGGQTRTLLARITADKSALLARMVTSAVGKHAGLLARLRLRLRLRAGNEMKHEQTKPIAYYTIT